MARTVPGVRALQPYQPGMPIAELERRTGRPVRIVTDPGLAIEGAAAQIVPYD